MPKEITGHLYVCGGGIKGGRLRRQHKGRDQRGPGASNPSKRASKACGPTMGCTAGALCHGVIALASVVARAAGGRDTESAVPEEAGRAFTAAHTAFPAGLLLPLAHRGAAGWAGQGVVSIHLASRAQLCGHRSGLRGPGAPLVLPDPAAPAGPGGHAAAIREGTGWEPEAQK